MSAVSAISVMNVLRVVAAENSKMSAKHKLKALEGRPIIAQGKRDSGSAPPWVTKPNTQAANCDAAR